MEMLNEIIWEFFKNEIAKNAGVEPEQVNQELIEKQWWKNIFPKKRYINLDHYSFNGEEWSKIDQIAENFLASF